MPLLKQVCFACCSRKLAGYDSCVAPLCVVDSTDCSGVLKLALWVACVLPLCVVDSADCSGVLKACFVGWLCAAFVCS